MNNSKKSKAIKTLAIILGTLVLLLAAVVVYIVLNVSQIWSDPGFDPNAAISDENSADPEASGLPEASYKGGDVSQIVKTEGNIDILLLGVDNRNTGSFKGLSDVIIYLRIDTRNKTIKLASLMRDTLVEIDGKGLNKLNAAYSLGGYKLTEQTIKDNFGLTPDYYVVVNFYGMEDIINAFDGVDIDVHSNELEWLNININEINSEDSGKDAANINNSGMKHLNGRQAVAYMRIRHPGGDQGRVARQQKVLSELFGKAKNISLGDIPNVVSTLTQYIRTDMPVDKILSLANAVKEMGSGELKAFRYPDDIEVGSYKGRSIVQPKDFDIDIKKLQDFLKD